MTDLSTRQYILGETREEIIIDNRDDVKLLSLALAEQARHDLDIFSQDLEAEIYNNKAFEQALFRFVQQRPGANVRILCYDSRLAVSNGHCLIRLAQNLTSSIFIHTPSREHAGIKSSYLIADKKGLLLRKNAINKNYVSSVNFYDPQQAISLAQEFEDIWQHSVPDQNVRRIYI
jgi:hypothetical protein